MKNTQVSYSKKNATKLALSRIRKAIEDFNMIKENDHVAVGVSGGKDSLVLAYLLQELRKHKILKFDLSAIHISYTLSDDMANTDKLHSFFDNLDIPLHIEKSNIHDVVFKIRKEANPCSLCSNMRRGTLSSVCKRIGANVLALGHHKDDFVNTFFLSLFHEGRMHTYSPTTFWDRSNINVIRPLLFIEEPAIEKIASYCDLPIIESSCPVNKNTKREEIKKILSEIYSRNPKIKYNVFAAIQPKVSKDLSKSNNTDLMSIEKPLLD